MLVGGDSNQQDEQAPEQTGEVRAKSHRMVSSLLKPSRNRHTGRGCADGKGANGNRGETKGGVAGGRVPRAYRHDGVMRPDQGWGGVGRANNSFQEPRKGSILCCSLMMLAS